MSRILYFRSKDDQKLWISKMQESIGQSSLEDFYNLEQTIGQGQFG